MKGRVKEMKESSREKIKHNKHKINIILILTNDDIMQFLYRQHLDSFFACFTCIYYFISGRFTASQ